MFKFVSCAEVTPEAMYAVPARAAEHRVSAIEEHKPEPKTYSMPYSCLRPYRIAEVNHTRHKSFHLPTLKQTRRENAELIFFGTHIHTQAPFTTEKHTQRTVAAIHTG